MNSFDFEGLPVEWEIEWGVDDDGDTMLFEVFSPAGRQLTNHLSQEILDRILTACWDEYWRLVP